MTIRDGADKEARDLIMRRALSKSKEVRGNWSTVKHMPNDDLALHMLYDAAMHLHETGCPPSWSVPTAAHLARFFAS